ncbi:60 kDa SS-A/Ro ribonucleoprotein [Chitinivorax tropicus]|uniref:60 kDa SS-A/Ro ribonucleoprotein n=1 Tax=Chitinivorax tropicus TaxID=714531 RepID=A0A840MKE1_9PROT|nr:RNA-binding protein [Chitinivorax tropicus]MBB5017172.1 60 kDa SS-A/Ro ribonucleoprotein [Chitinivorax tropicus]
MANTHLFQTQRGTMQPRHTTLNASGSIAYQLSPQHALAQYAITGCLNNTYYANAEAQLAEVLRLTDEVEAEFIAKAAIYCREKGYMKDMPALLAAVLTVKGPQYVAPVFKRVIDNGRMLRQFVQILRSGAVGRKSLGTRPKKLVQAWLNQASDEKLMQAAVGNTPSLADVVKMVHPKPDSLSREAFFAWLIGRPYQTEHLPAIVQQFEAYKADKSATLPNVPFQMLTALALGREEWARIAEQGGWQMVRMNLNTFARHGVFDIPGMAGKIAAKLANPELVARARAFPYQLLAAYKMAGQTVPATVREALQDAMEAALDNVPSLAGNVVVCPDVSGSMQSPVTGYRQGATTAVRCIDVAGLMAAAILRKNPAARAMPFEVKVVGIKLNPRDSVITNAEKLAAIGGGGTNCSAPLAKLNQEKALVDTVVIVSDNESWVDDRRHGATETMRQWALIKQRNPLARLVCIDIQPYATTQAQERDDILNIGGFGDDVFKLIASFAAGQMQPGHWVQLIESVSLD